LDRIKRKKCPSEETFTLLVSPDGREDSLSIHQDAFISQITLGAGSEGEYALKKEGNGIFIFVVSGSVLVEEETLHDRDAIGLAGYSTVLIRSDKACELLVVEVPMIA
jgi:redox-sensitive bicupin YhaK (pirin superfamily)